MIARCLLLVALLAPLALAPTVAAAHAATRASVEASAPADCLYVDASQVPPAVYVAPCGAGWRSR